MKELIYIRNNLIFISFLYLIHLNYTSAFILRGSAYHHQQKGSNRGISSTLFLKPIVDLSSGNVVTNDKNSIYESLSSIIDDTSRFLRRDDDEEEEYILCVPEEDDLPALSEFIVEAFGADTIALSTTDSDGISRFEKALIEPAMGFFNGYFALTAYTEVLAGLRKRFADRYSSSSEIVNSISPPQIDGLSNIESIETANKGSLLLLVVATAKAQIKINKSKQLDPSSCNIVASVELRLQPTDGKVPFTLPFLDRIERGMASFIGYEQDDDNNANEQSSATTATKGNRGDDSIGTSSSSLNLQPYLSTLCVKESYRKKGLGRDLVKCLEIISSKKIWGYQKLFLHVDNENEPAYKLYQNEGYYDSNKRWTPGFWSESSATNIAYLVKDI